MSDVSFTKRITLGRCICIITGASKGFGRALAHEVSCLLSAGSVLVLVARTGTLLQELKEKLQSNTKKQRVLVHCVTADLSTKDGVNKTVMVAKQECVKEIDHVLLINNAASLGDIYRFTRTFTDPDEALPSWVLYCTAKAARSMMFSVLAKEEPNVKVLSYSPGPMDTEMQKEVQRLSGIKHDLLPCQESAAKLMKVLLGNDFQSGANLDFFDV
ncbi:sepiapterin reductase b [Thalassophryne amazonica]|uniref:sepiapterin reductase b n=1 Tax=Thalassophryne amazonica TaxID=390379 RepID=UPI001472439C|nr:sepiapterin reductase b [Thalassophryne amazonica]